MKYTTNKKMHILERDNSPSKYCITGDYAQIDPNKLNFNEWKDKALALDPEVDMTYWEFDIKFSKELEDKYLAADEYFIQKKYIITNRRVVHVFNNDPYYHASGFHTKPTNVIEFLKGLYIPDSVRFMKGSGPTTYELKNKENKIKSFLNIQDQKYLKIQTSYLNEGFALIESLNYVYCDNIDAFDKVILSESYLQPLQDKYLLIEKFLYTYNPNVIALGNSFGYPSHSMISLSLDEEQIPTILKNTKFIEEEVGCHYLIDGNNLTLVLK